MAHTVKREIVMASSILRKSDDTIVTPATSIATSLPAPIAILKSACAKAALSLIPSPTINSADTTPPHCTDIINMPITKRGTMQSLDGENIFFCFHTQHDLYVLFICAKIALLCPRHVTQFSDCVISLYNKFQEDLSQVLSTF